MKPLKIEKGIPYVKPIHDYTRQARLTRQKYPWVDMEVGDSVKTNETDIDGKAMVAARSHGCKTGKKFRTAREDDGTIRVWRVS